MDIDEQDLYLRSQISLQTLAIWVESSGLPGVLVWNPFGKASLFSAPPPTRTTYFLIWSAVSKQWMLLCVKVLLFLP